MNLKIVVQFKQTFQVYPKPEIVPNGGILFFSLQTRLIASSLHAHFKLETLISSTKITLKTLDNESQTSQKDLFSGNINIRRNYIESNLLSSKIGK